MRLISRADAARMLGVSRAAVTQACRAGGRLRRARRGHALDAGAAELAEWIRERQLRAEGRAPASFRADPAPRGHLAFVRPRPSFKPHGNQA